MPEEEYIAPSWNREGVGSAEVAGQRSHSSLPTLQCNYVDMTIHSAPLLLCWAGEELRIARACSITHTTVRRVGILILTEQKSGFASASLAHDSSDFDGSFRRGVH